ncbi:MAG: zinc-dependent metalloprotease [Bifidobacteriaceae bacterium]|nr:zinc-dependent metalloprotease [Bifidobacteriaceae bacterium]
MSTDPTPYDGDLPPEFVELFRALFGDQADEAMAAFREQGFDPRQVVEAAGLAPNAANLGFLVEQIRRVMQAPHSDQPVNWELAHDTARQAAIAGGPDPVVSDSAARAVTEALNLAELWLDRATELSRAGGPARALSAAQWVEAALPQWQAITTPVAKSMKQAMTQVITKQQEEHPGLGEAMAGATNMVQGIAGGMFGMQLGQAIGQLAREVFGFTDNGLPMGGRGVTALLPSSVAAFTEGTGLPADEVRLFLAAREAAHARLFTHVPWLADHLFGAVEAYAAGISIDLDRLEEAVRDINPQDPSSLRQALSSGVFEPDLSPAQQSALARLETTLALVEGWVDVVVADALTPNLPDVAALRELMRRRRAEGGPAEHTFTTLVGLELRPRRAREATRLWEAVADQLGQVEREAVWGHPDLLPLSEDLDQPEQFPSRLPERRQADAAFDAELAAFLEAEGGSGGPEPGA